MQSKFRSKKVSKAIQMYCLLENEKSKSLIIHLRAKLEIMLRWEIGHEKNLRKVVPGQDQDLQ